MKERINTDKVCVHVAEGLRQGGSSVTQNIRKKGRPLRTFWWVDIAKDIGVSTLCGFKIHPYPSQGTRTPRSLSGTHGILWPSALS